MKWPSCTDAKLIFESEKCFKQLRNGAPIANFKCAVSELKTTVLYVLPAEQFDRFNFAKMDHFWMDL